jgi:hypothetical protein
MHVRTITSLLGAGGGAALAIACVLLAAQVGTSQLLASPVVIAIATPAAHVVSWIIGWPLRQEAALVCYALGFLFTIAGLGALAGGVAGGLAGPRADARRRA